MSINQLRSYSGYYDTLGQAIYQNDIVIATMGNIVEAHVVQYDKGVWSWNGHALQDVIKESNTRVVGQFIKQPTKTLNELHSLIQSWSKQRELDKADPMKQMVKLMEEIGELANGLNKSNDKVIVDSVGDVFVVLTILCQQLNIDLTSCVAAAYDEIKDRKGQLVNGIFVKEQDLKKE